MSEFTANIADTAASGGLGDSGGKISGCKVQPLAVWCNTGQHQKSPQTPPVQQIAKEDDNEELHESQSKIERRQIIALCLRPTL